MQLVKVDEDNNIIYYLRGYCSLSNTLSLYLDQKISLAPQFLIHVFKQIMQIILQLGKGNLFQNDIFQGNFIVDDFTDDD